MRAVHNVHRHARALDLGELVGFGRHGPSSLRRVAWLTAGTSRTSFQRKYRLNRTGFIGGPIPREDGPDAPTQQVLPGAA